MSENALTIDGGLSAKPALPAPAPVAGNGLVGMAALKARFMGLIQQPAVAKSLPLLGMLGVVALAGLALSLIHI